MCRPLSQWLRAKARHRRPSLCRCTWNCSAERQLKARNCHPPQLVAPALPRRRRGESLLTLRIDTFSSWLIDLCENPLKDNSHLRLMNGSFGYKDRTLFCRKQVFLNKTHRISPNIRKSKRFKSKHKLLILFPAFITRKTGCG